MSGAAAPGGISLARHRRVPPGLRLAVKDLFDTARLVTTYGSRIFSEHRTEASAEAVERLEAAGYVVVGKTNLDEFAYGVSGRNPWFGPVPNPRAPGLAAGGSSGGSAAALAAGLADAALGSDSGGSIRIPAACCGVVGFKPTFGRVPLAGCFPLAPSFDTAGPMARTVSGCAAMMRALDPGVAAGALASMEEVVVGVAWLGECARPVRAQVEAAAGRFPRRVDLDLPHPGPWADWIHTFRHEAAETHRDLLREHAGEYGPVLRRRLQRDLGVSDAQAEAGRRARAEYRERCLAAIEGVDVVIAPTLPCLPPARTERRTMGRPTGDLLTHLTHPVNALGWPALSLPAGPSASGPPASLQLLARPGEDALVLAVGAALERAVAG
jgi:Asp-tRNA(Asn)/Glu-tRNA(Gln) amidotransferase A subunit family amidase